MWHAKPPQGPGRAASKRIRSDLPHVPMTQKAVIVARGRPTFFGRSDAELRPRAGTLLTYSGVVAGLLPIAASAMRSL